MTNTRGLIPAARMHRAADYMHIAESEVATMLVGLRLAREFPEVAEDVLICMAASPYMGADSMDLLNRVARYIATGESGDARTDYAIENAPKREKKADL